jgi:hypothetical protein
MIMRTIALLACASLCGCGVVLRDGAAQDACSELNAAFCERLSDCDGSVDNDACVAADDGLGGACASASVVELEADVATCAEAITDMECARIEDRTSPDFDLDCVKDVRFEDD